MLQFNNALTKENFLLFAAKEYNNPNCIGVSEFNADLKRFMYIKRLLKRHLRGKDFDFRLLVNHIVIINNLFDSKSTCRMLYFYCESSTWKIITAILLYLKILVKDIPELNGSKLESDEKIKKLLQEL